MLDVRRCATGQASFNVCFSVVSMSNRRVKPLFLEFKTFSCGGFCLTYISINEYCADYELRMLTVETKVTAIYKVISNIFVLSEICKHPFISCVDKHFWIWISL